MPGGQWVAFEGYDTPHKCDTAPPLPTPKISSTQEGRNQAVSEKDLDFYEIDIKGAEKEAPRLPQQAVGKAEKQQSFQDKTSTPNASVRTPPKPRRSGFPHWIWWLVGALVILWLMNKR